MSTPRVLLAGNPNAGKTTLFNRLTGSSARVGNYPGVTVECSAGTLRCDDTLSVELVDLPGTYSLSARSPEERVAVDALFARGEAAPTHPPMDWGGTWSTSADPGTLNPLPALWG